MKREQRHDPPPPGFFGGVTGTDVPGIWLNPGSVG
jgi:hypothetical protein